MYIKTLTLRFDSLSLEISNLRTKVDLLESKIHALKSKTSNTSTVPSSQITDVIQEFTERKRCKLNVLMYGISLLKLTTIKLLHVIYLRNSLPIYTLNLNNFVLENLPPPHLDL